MKKTMLSLVAALTLGGAFAAAAADAQRTIVRTHHTTIVHRTVHTRGHHRTCRTVVRHHRRVRTCRTW